MKCVIPEISWHNRDPVLSVDIQPRRDGDASTMYRLASGGTDSHVLIWHVMHSDTGTINLEIAASLTRHQRPVNVVRWSPSGEYLASGDDESIIFVWKMKNDTETLNILDTTNEQDKEIWLTFKVLRGHMEDVYDLCWAPNSHQLISGSVDNTAMVWDVQKGKSQAILREHNSFVQGVAWDPQNQLLATLSSDRHFRAFDAATWKLLTRSSKCTLPVPESSALRGKVLRIFHDDTLQTFFRRLSFSPDGELVVTPSGVAEMADAKALHTTYIYTRYNMKQPALVLPSPDQYTVAVRFCPIFYKLNEYDAKRPPIIELPYRMIFAVATKSSVFLYDTQQSMPIGLISNIHYTRLTDLAWSHDGRILIVSSTDGFCTLITFAAGELGVAYSSDEESKENSGETKNSIVDEPMEANCATDKTNSDTTETSIDVDKEPAAATATKPKPPLQATPIAIRRKPRAPTQTEQSAPKPETVEDAVAAAANIIVVNTPEKVIALEIPTGIIKTTENFDSPEIITNKPATPIQIRRAPRTAATPSQGHFTEVANNKEPASPEPSDEGQKTTAPTTSDTNGQSVKKSAKKANPIAIRRHQRNVAPVSSDAAPKVNVSVNEDEAMDAWPIDQPRPDTERPNDNDTKPIDAPIVPAVVHAIDVDETEDIRLVYDDDSQMADAESKPVVENSTPNPKTPRRVELRTISTPKAKKKLL